MFDVGFYRYAKLVFLPCNKKENNLKKRALFADVGDEAEVELAAGQVVGYSKLGV